MSTCRPKRRVLSLALGVTLACGIATAALPRVSNARLASSADTEISFAMAKYPWGARDARWWLDASYPVRVFSNARCRIQAVDAEPVLCWEDRAVEQNKLAPVEPEHAPILVSEAMNGRDVIAFNGTPMKGRDAFGAPVQQIQIFIVFRELVRTSSDVEPVLLSLNGLESGENRFAVLGPDKHGLLSFDSGADAASPRLADAPGDEDPNRAWAPALGPETTTLVTAWKDLNRDVSGLQVNDGDPHCARLNLEANAGGGLRLGDHTEHIEIAEVIVAHYRLPDAKEQRVENYLLDKWGIERGDRTQPPSEECHTPSQDARGGP